MTIPLIVVHLLDQLDSYWSTAGPGLLLFNGQKYGQETERKTKVSTKSSVPHHETLTSPVLYQKSVSRMGLQPDHTMRRREEKTDETKWVCSLWRKGKQEEEKDENDGSVEKRKKMISIDHIDQ